jgi:hypothetical protein
VALAVGALTSRSRRDRLALQALLQQTEYSGFLWLEFMDILTQRLFGAAPERTHHRSVEV